MIKDLKLGIKMLRYCFKTTQFVVVAAIFFLIGIGYAFISLPNTVHLKYVYWLIDGVFCTQMLLSLSISSMVQSSPRKKALQTSVPALMSLACNLVMYVFAVALQLLVWKLGMGGHDESSGFILFGVLAMLTMSYSGAGYKKYLITTSIYVVAIMVYCVGGTGGLFAGLPQFPVGIAILIGLAEILAGAGLHYALSLLFYRQPISKFAQHRQLQRYL